MRPRAAATITRPDGPGRQAVPRLPRRPREGARFRRPVAEAGAHASAAGRSVTPAPTDAPRRLRWIRWSAIGSRPRPPDRRLGPRELLLVPRRRHGGEQAAAARPRRQVLDRTGCCHEPTDDPAARHRPRAARSGRETANRIGLDHARAHRPEPAPPRVPLDPARPPRRDSRPRRRRRSTPAMQLGGPALAVKTVRDFTGLPINHVVIVDFSAFEELIDALGGIDDRRARARSSRTFDCPYPTQERCAQWDGLALREGQAAHGRPAGADLLARSREPARTRPTTTSRAASASRQVAAGDRDKLTGSGRSCKLPFIGDDLVAPLATDLSTPAVPRGSAGRSSARAARARSTAGSAASRAAASHPCRPRRTAP